MPSPVRTLWRGIAPPPALRSYTVISLIDTIGTGMFMAGSVVYFQRAIGLSGSQIGFGLSLAMFVSLAGPVPAGRVGDRFGHRRILCTLNCATGLAFAAYPLVRGYLGFLLIACAIGLLQAASSPARRAVLSQLIPADQRVRSSAYIRSVSNIGFTVGTAATGVLILAGSELALDAIVVTNAVSYLVAAILTMRLRVQPAVVRPAPAERSASAAASPYRDRPFLLVSVLSGLLMTHESLLAVALPLYVLKNSGPAWLIPAVLILNTVLAILLQVPASRGAEGLAGGGRALVRAAVALTVCCAVFAGGRPSLGALLFVIVVVAVLALTIGELFSSVGAWSVSYAMADGPRQGEYLGVFSTVQQATAIGGPVAMALVVRAATPGWLVLGVVYAALGLAVRVAVRRQSPAEPVRTAVGA